MTESTEKSKIPYLADMGGLFGAPPTLTCQCCKKKDWELFYGHCKSCAKEKSIPLEMVSVEKFHESANQGSRYVYTDQHWFKRVLKVFGIGKK
jgi:hypothetical protein